MSEAELVTRILAGEDRLFTQIVERYSGCVWAVCSSYVRNPSECEDVAQEVFVQCYRQLNTLRNPRALGRWLCQMARRHCLMWLRSSSRREQHLARYEAMGGVRMESTSDSAREELHETIRETIDRLPADYREALLLRFAEGYSVEEASALLGISQAAMRKRIERAQNALKTMMWDQVEPALASRKHDAKLAGAIVAAIPFGAAPWLGAGVSGGAAAGAAGTVKLMGGTTAMIAKWVAACVGLLIVAGGIYTAARVSRPSGTVSAPIASTVVSSESSAVPATDGTRSSSISGRDAMASSPTPLQTTGAPAKAAEPSCVSGRVTNEAGIPIDGAEVVLDVGRGFDRNDVAAEFTAKTGRDGSYRIAGVNAAGPSVAYAVADGFAMAFNALRISAGQTKNGIDIALEPAEWHIAGKVIDEHGSPVVDASVDCLYYAYDKLGLAETAITGRTTGNIGGIRLVFAHTAGDGSFQIAIPSPGLADFRVVKQGFGTGFFAQVPTGKQDVAFVLKPGGAIAGKVVDSDGRPRPGATVHVTGEVRPGGLPFSLAKIQPLLAPPATVMTDAAGVYRVDDLGEAFSYTAEIPGDEIAAIDRLPTERGVQVLARMMCEFDLSTSGGTALARKAGLAVKPGQTTPDADLVIGAIRQAIIHGKVTSRDSGEPACPVVIAAADFGTVTSTKGMNYFSAKAGASAVTLPDGSYTIRIANLARPTHYSIRLLYMTEGGSAWEQPEEELTALDIKPGDTIERDFAVDAAVTVPVRYTGPNGSPRQGVEAAMRTAGARGGCGGILVSDAEGRVEFHGVRPLVSLQAAAWMPVASHANTLGISAPFTGLPGETVAEVPVVCRLPGGIAGVLTSAEGRPVSQATLVCGGQTAEGTLERGSDSATTDASGHFQIADVLPEGTYQGIVVGFLDTNDGMPYSVTAPNVEVVPGSVTDLGTLVATPEKDLVRVVEAVGYDHASNRAIAGIYTLAQLANLPDSLLLKTAFAIYDFERYDEALEIFQRLASVSERDPLGKAIALVWQGHMLDLLGRRQEAIEAYTAAAAMNVTDEIRHDQFGLSYAPAEEAQRRLTEPFERVENKS